MLKSVKKQLWIIIALALVAGGYFIALSYLQINISENFVSPSSDLYERKLDGVKVAKKSENLLPVSIMIENHTDARPQSGLAEAKIVYEFLSEYHITRFLAVYDLSEDLEKIGPVRSARPYSIDLANEYGGIFVHSGGSPKSLEMLKKDLPIYDLNEFFGYNSEYFTRLTQRKAPHNLYTSTSQLIQAKKDGWLTDNGDFKEWSFKDDAAGQSPQASLIEINYSTSNKLFQVLWEYMPDNNEYKRWQAQQPQLDENNRPIISKNIIIQYADHRVIDEVGRREITLDTKGEATVFLDGLMVDAKWQKENGRTTFYDKNGNEIEFNRGPIWVQIVPLDIIIDIE